MTSDSKTGDEEPSQTDADETPESVPGASVSPLPLIAGAVLLVVATVGSIAWFLLTEPPAPVVGNTTATVANETPTEQRALGFTGDRRRPSEIIRAARRAQERTGDSDATR